MKFSPGCGCCGSPDCPECCRYRAPFLGGWTSGDPRTLEFTVTISGSGENILAVPGPGYTWVPWPQLNGTYTLTWHPISEGTWSEYQWNVTIGNVAVGLRMWCDYAETGIPMLSPLLAITEVVDGVRTAGLNFSNFVDETWSGYNPGAFGPYGEASVSLSSSEPMQDGCCCFNGLCMPEITELEGSTLSVAVASGFIDPYSWLAGYIHDTFLVPIETIFSDSSDPCDFVATWNLPEEEIDSGVTPPGFGPEDGFDPESCGPVTVYREVTVELNVPENYLLVNVIVRWERTAYIIPVCPAGGGGGGNVAQCFYPIWQPIAGGDPCDITITVTA